MGISIPVMQTEPKSVPHKVCFIYSAAYVEGKWGMHQGQYCGFNSPLASPLSLKYGHCHCSKAAQLLAQIQVWIRITQRTEDSCRDEVK